MRPAADDVLNFWPVGRAVNNLLNNGADLLDTLDDPARPPPPSNAPTGDNPV
jgi:hypothetical protein